MIVCITFGLNKYGSRTAITLDKRHGNDAWLLGAIQNGGNEVEMWAYFETNFIKKTCTLVAKMSVRVLT